MEARYRDETGIAALKIKHNGVLGYFIEVPARSADRLMVADSGFTHRQTMAGAVRFNSLQLHEEASRIAEAGVRSVDDVRAQPQPLIAFSSEMAAAERNLKRFMYARLYHHPQQMAVADQARAIVAGLADAYFANPQLLPDEWRARLPDSEPDRSRHIGDFIAGMTDRYAVARYREVVGPVEMSDGD